MVWCIGGVITEEGNILNMCVHGHVHLYTPPNLNWMMKFQGLSGLKLI